ncbi:MAG: hypothetical protein J5715_07770 [Clostridiales bacterium]|nr:hypothetical protein [Clostridiales bacterium]
MDYSKFMKGAFDALVARGVIDSSVLTEVRISDDEFEALEKECDIQIPDEVRAYLRAYGHSFNMLATPVPEDLYAHSDYVVDISKQINMTPDEIAELDEDDKFDLSVTWSDFIKVDKDNPLKGIKDAIEGFRGYASCVENPEIDEEKINRFLPVGEWMSAGSLCIDTSKKKEDVDIDDPDTWQIRWFDHEELDWESEGYIGEDGDIVGSVMFPDLETIIKLYFYGAFDQAYLAQCEDWGEEPEDRNTWVQ